MLKYAKIWTQKHKFTDDKLTAKESGDGLSREESEDVVEGIFFKDTIVY